MSHIFCNEISPEKTLTIKLANSQKTETVQWKKFLNSKLPDWKFFGDKKGSSKGDFEGKIRLIWNRYHHLFCRVYMLKNQRENKPFFLIQPKHIHYSILIDSSTSMRRPLDQISFQEQVEEKQKENPKDSNWINITNTLVNFLRKEQNNLRNE